MSRLTRQFALLLTFGLIISWTSNVYGTHNRAGEITYEQIGELTIRVTITTYTKTSSLQADRDTLDIFWGDGTMSKLGRVNGFGDVLPNDIKRNFYVGEHTYPGRATYHISTTDPNRIAGILNVNAPNSIKIPFHIETTFTFLNSQFQGPNNSAILLQPPIDFACVGQRYIHNPNAFDPDGDSLSYELIVPLEDVNQPVPNYRFPDQIMAGSNNILTLDERTGDLVWNAPQRVGEYNVAFKIHEYRQGVLLNSIIRDMQILVEDCDDTPPIVEAPAEICVIAGTVIEFDVRAYDEDVPAQQLSLSALGGPFEVDVSPATFVPGAGYRDQPIDGVFRWQTTCEHISDQTYSVVFKAVDDLLDTTGLATLKTTRIKVVGPPPERFLATSTADGNLISWDQPYACDMVENDYFKGFTVWRRTSSNQFPIDTCNPSMADKGYTAIAFQVKDFENGRYFYLDETVEPGSSYCYRVTATFALTSAAGYSFNLVESIPSDEDCTGLPLENPFITKVSVVETDVTNGAIQVEWTKPNTEVLDTNIFSGPYQFTVLRGEGFNPTNLIPVTGGVISSNTFAGLDTQFLDQTGLNTVASPYTYQIYFYSQNLTNNLNQSQQASSVFLNVAGSDNQNIITWEAEVPWENYSFKIFRQDEGSADFVLVGTTTETEFVDRGLTNGINYCYYIETEGAYGFSMLPEPLFNLSQVTCQIPFDAVPPCVPILSAENSCNNEELFRGGMFLNQLNWSIPTIGCDNPNDVSGYRVYFSPTPDGEFNQIGEINDPDETQFEHGDQFGIAGCYTVSALDSLGNESLPSNVVCVENCPFYSLPNTFTPNSDGANDVFKPFPYKFIDRIDLKVFNRWGQLVFETSDPDINWDGKNQGGTDLSQGTYHYVCQVFEAGNPDQINNEQVLKGYIELIR